MATRLETTFTIERAARRTPSISRARKGRTFREYDARPPRDKHAYVASRAQRDDVDNARIRHGEAETRIDHGTVSQSSRLYSRRIAGVGPYVRMDATS